MIADPQAWIQAITSGEGRPRETVDPSLFTKDKVLFLLRQSEWLVEKAEAIRGIQHEHKTVTVNDQTKPVLYRDATRVKATLTEDEQNKIADYEFQATWCISAAAAINMANQLDDDKKERFLSRLNILIDRHITHSDSESGKEIYLRKMQSLFSLLGAFFPTRDLSDLSNELEAERDMLFLNEPTALVATCHQHSADRQERIYDIEFPNTELSETQKKFFAMLADENKSENEINVTYLFYATLKPWQKSLIRRHAKDILQENRLRPSQMQFLPMAPNFWTRHTVIQKSDKTTETVNVISRCGALSPRIDGNKNSLITFQKMQYSQVRHHFNLAEDDTLCYTSYKQHFLGMGADDSALENISITHDTYDDFKKRNAIFNIPMGRFAPLSRLLNKIRIFSQGNEFEDNDHDPLTESVSKLIYNDIVNPLNLAHQDISPLIFEQANLGEHTDDYKQLYHYAKEIQRLRRAIFFKNNKRIAALRSVLFYRMSTLLKKLGREQEMVYQAYVSGCKSNIDRGTLVTLHAEIDAIKEYERRKWWHKEVKQPATTTSWLGVKLFFTNMALSHLFPLTSFFNYLSQAFTGKTLYEHRGNLSHQLMQRDLPGINQALDNSSLSDIQRGELLDKKYHLIDRAIRTDVDIELVACRSGHSRIMPAHGGSLSVSGIKNSVVNAVSPHLEEQMVHLSSQKGLSSHNHHLAEKCGIKPSAARDWVHPEDQQAVTAPVNYTYVPPAFLYDNQPTQTNEKVVSFSGKYQPDTKGKNVAPGSPSYSRIN